LGVTTVFVTHDQDEALSLSDRIAVMADGVVHQVGTPEDVYLRPADLFVADFVGTANLLPGAVVADGGDTVEVKVDGLAPTVHAAKAMPGPLSAGDVVTVAVRPEAILVRDPAEAGAGSSLHSAEVVDRAFLGDHHRYRVRVGKVLVVVQTTRRPPDDERLTIEIPPGSARAYLPQESLDG
jgi:iron(III) transport system ATP-binding protein